MGMGMHVSYIFWKWNMNQAPEGDNYSLFDRGLHDGHSKDCLLGPPNHLKYQHFSAF